MPMSSSPSWKGVTTWPPLISRSITRQTAAATAAPRS
jgi:hypothetical protein